MRDVWVLSLLLLTQSVWASDSPASDRMLRLPLARRALSGNEAVSLSSLRNNQYLVTVELGTPPQPLVLQLDTGSNALWTGSSNCQQTSKCNNAHAFDPSKSSTFKDTSNGAAREVNYVVGKVTGKAAADTLVVGPFTVRQQPFLLVENEDMLVQSSNDGIYDGVLGLAWQSGVLDQTRYFPTFMNGLISQGIAARFSVYLDSNAAPTDAAATLNGGEIVFGAIDTTRVKGAILTYNVVDPYYWAISLTSFSVNTSRNALLTIPSGTTAIFDTGATLLQIERTFLTTQLLPVLYSTANVPMPSSPDTATGLYPIPCEASVPSIAFYFTDGVPHVVDGAFLKAPSGTACVLALAGQPSNAWILGDVFLRGRVAVFDWGSAAKVGTGALFGEDGGPSVGLDSVYARNAGGTAESASVTGGGSVKAGLNATESANPFSGAGMAFHGPGPVLLESSLTGTLVSRTAMTTSTFTTATTTTIMTSTTTIMSIQTSVYSAPVPPAAFSPSTLPPVDPAPMTLASPTSKTTIDPITLPTRVVGSYAFQNQRNLYNWSILPFISAFAL
ncbi:aspartic peptidase domain-containing protein [Chytriomyces sp. MP71]|nr:aspartic peptidase domain-containing protein [Chytriomyces sp. MP71]